MRFKRWLSLGHAGACWQPLEERNRGATQAQAAAVGFATTLTTYDYAHLDVQSRALGAFASSHVVAIVKQADTDVMTARATSIGSVSAAWVVRSDGHEAEVVVATSQVARFGYAPDPKTLAGRIDIVVGRFGTSWLVTSFAWLAAPAPPAAESEAATS